jgi:hypothetical protein
MKYIRYSFCITTSLLIMLAVNIPEKTNAQRFNHANFSRPAAPPPALRPMPAMRPAPAPVRQASPPPAVVNRTINGGSRNIGNHDFNAGRNVVVDQHVNVNPRANARDHVSVYHTGAYRGIHPYYYHPYRPYYWGPRWHPFGFFISALAASAIRFSFGNQWYYYDDGCYYLPSGNGYAVVAPPYGAVVSYLPDGYETCPVGDTDYYYFGGVFYVAVAQGYQVVQAPIGAVVTQLPDGAVEQQDGDGNTELVYNNVYYLPISQDGQDAYQVVQSN